jgi:hypothetical protein
MSKRTLVVLAVLTVVAVIAWKWPRSVPDGGTTTQQNNKTGPTAAEPQSQPHPTEMQLREHKVKGSKYHCTLVGTVEGRGTREGWYVIRGGACFLYQSWLEWDSEVIENDVKDRVHIFTEKRTFKDARAANMVSTTGFGLTRLGTDIAKTGIFAIAAWRGIPPDTAKEISELGEFLNDQRFLKIPWFGPWVKEKLDRAAKDDPHARALRVTQKLLADLEDKEVIVTWHDGKLYECRATVGGLSDTDKEYASKAAVFADMNIFPPDHKKIGESWVVASKEVADYFNTEADVKEAVTGKIRLVRDQDLDIGKVAVVNGAGDGQFSGKKYRGSATMQGMRAEFVYGMGNNYLTSCVSSGVVHYMHLDQGHLLFGVKTTIEPSILVRYTCEQR